MGNRRPMPDDLGMETTTNIIKSVAYAYPSSPDAQRFHFPFGCYTVCIETPGKPAVAISAFATLAAAEHAARAINGEWSRYSMIKD